VLTSWSGNASLGNNNIDEFFWFNWFIFLTHLAIPQDTRTTLPGNLNKKIFRFQFPQRSSSKLKRTLTSFLGTRLFLH
jgi:hypothetical protein